ncbi:LOW QUALITY PROTEIN: hypothetical protein PHMEG_00021579 [Phytophthora megakarya]|uniref:Uncharacterized protein n=1 Tax=Phytophthora megakarya TaxID=4795 RepID=A0A225VLI1_9STRA|nr:LOW QUALITY PROTEIN: hypothetical protein PHMEG_00021579 [Phytophthora megakarya]
MLGESSDLPNIRISVRILRQKRWPECSRRLLGECGTLKNSTHSLRTGGATAPLSGKADSLSIKLLSRWISRCFEEYPLQKCYCNNRPLTAHDFPTTNIKSVQVSTLGPLGTPSKVADANQYN